MNLKEAAILLLLAAIWGASFLFIRIAVPVLGPAFLVEIRLILATGILLLYALATKNTLVWQKYRGKYLLVGAFNCALPFLLVSTAELHLTASLASLLNATIPLFTAIVAAFWGQERFTLQKGFGLVLGFLGVGILVGWSPLPLDGKFFFSVGLSLLASFFYGVGGVYSKVNFKDTAPLSLAIAQQFWGCLLLLPIALFSIPKTMPSFTVILAVIALALFSTALAYVLYFSLLKSIGATNTHSVAFLIPVFGLLWGTIFLGESVTVGSFVGLSLVFGSIIFVSDFNFGRGEHRGV